MPTTQPLDDELGDIAGGQLRSIAGFAQPGAQVTGQAPRADVPRATTPSSSHQPAADAQKPQVAVAASHHNSTTGARMGVNIKMPGVSLNGPRNNPTQAPVAHAQTPSTTPSPKRLTPYDDAAIKKAWQNFIDANHAEHLLINAMKVATPERLSGDTFRIAQSAVHIGYIRDNIERITQFARNFAANDNIAFTLEEVSEDSPTIWNERELLGRIIEDNPYIEQFIRNLGLTLS